MASNPHEATEVRIAIEQEKAGRYKIRSDQLEQIGTQLRGKRHFSVFNSIVLPIIVTVLTTLLTTSLQYVSWWNSVSLQNATDQWTKAAETYEHTAAAIAKRHVATTLQIPSIRDLAKLDAPPPIRMASVATDGSGGASNAGDPPKSGAPTLTSLRHDLLKDRFESYYAQLRSWNESYDRNLHDIEYHLDRPIFEQSKRPMSKLGGFWDALERSLDCNGMLAKELDKGGFEKQSLKVQFTAIQICFGRLATAISVMSDAKRAYDEPWEKRGYDGLRRIYVWSNQLRCYAQSCVDYYHGQKESAILGPQVVWPRSFETRAAEVEKHFAATATHCDPKEDSPS
jgi:hypothetical protein